MYKWGEGIVTKTQLVFDKLIYTTASFGAEGMARATMASLLVSPFLFLPLQVK